MRQMGYALRENSYEDGGFLAWQFYGKVPEYGKNLSFHLQVLARHSSRPIVYLDIASP